MATANDIITRSFVRSGILGDGSALTASESQDGLSMLNDMLSEWESSGVILGFSTLADITDNVRIPRGANSAVIDALAIRLAPEYSRPVSPALLKSADDSYRNMLNMIVNLSDVDFPSTLPLGSGNHCDNGVDSRYFPQKQKMNF